MTGRAIIMFLLLGVPRLVSALPTGYLVWSHGTAGDPASRALHRMTLPAGTEIIQLTTTEAIEAKISPDGRWVAYAKAKLPGGSDYHDFNFWRLYVVSIHGTGDGRVENLIDDNGYWPSWSSDGKLYYSQVDGNHTRIWRATLDDFGRLGQKELLLATREAFASVPEVNECFMAPDASWFAARVRQVALPGVGAFTVNPPAYTHLAAAGSVGCMPIVARDGTWAIIAGSGYGIRWGDSPLVANRALDQQLIAPHGSAGLVYHPGISNDGRWVMAAHSTELNHNSGNYDVYIYALNGRRAENEELLLADGFNGWPDLWVGEPSLPPPPIPVIDLFSPSSYTIVTGEEVSLTWETSFADQAALDGVPVAVDGTAADSPTSTTVYELTALHSLNPGVPATAQVTVTVHSAPEAVVIDSFTIEPEQITAGEVALLSWQVTNPTTLAINGVAVAPIGTLTVEPLRDTTYTLTANGHQGPVTAELLLVVSEIETIPPALLPDRGGCMCGPRAPGGVGWLLLLLLARARGRRRA